MVANLDSLKGKCGVTTDNVFGVITDTLEKVGQVIEDLESDFSADGKAWAELVITKYKVVDNGYPKFYELWYQTHTPFSPQGMVCSFGFDEIEK